MRILWNLFKIILALAIAVPLGIFALAATIGIVGALVGLALLVLKLACVAFLGVVAWKVVASLFGSKPAPVAPLRALPPVDPYYAAAMRELDNEFQPTHPR